MIADRILFLSVFVVVVVCSLLLIPRSRGPQSEASSSPMGEWLSSGLPSAMSPFPNLFLTSGLCMAHLQRSYNFKKIKKQFF